MRNYYSTLYSYSGFFGVFHNIRISVKNNFLTLFYKIAAFIINPLIRLFNKYYTIYFKASQRYYFWYVLYFRNKLARRYL